MLVISSCGRHSQQHTDLVPPPPRSHGPGMGLNLPGIRRMIFASMHKYDGRSMRPLTAPEVKQIAGRAGRYASQHEEVRLSPRLAGWDPPFPPPCAPPCRAGGVGGLWLLSMCALASTHPKTGGRQWVTARPPDPMLLAGHRDVLARRRHASAGGCPEHAQRAADPSGRHAQVQCSACMHAGTARPRAWLLQ